MEKLSKKVCAFFESEGVFSLEDLKMGFELGETSMVRIPTKELIHRLRSNVEFPVEFEDEIYTWIESEKAQSISELFLKLASRRSRSSEAGGVIKRHKIPKETLFIAIKVTEGEFVAESLKEVLDTLKRSICDVLGVDVFDTKNAFHTASLMKELASMSWPSDLPIYVTENEFLEENEIVKLISSKAKLVITGAYFL